MTRIVFFGSGEFGVPTLRGLAEAGYDIPAVVSQPPRPAGRGGKCRPTPIGVLAGELGMSIRCPATPNTPEFEAELRSLSPDLAVIVAYGHLIGKPLLGIPRLGFVNLHGSLLPAYRGAAPVPRAILAGERESGVSVFQLDERFDTGAVIARTGLPIADDDTSATYLAKLAPLGGRTMLAAVADIVAGKAVRQPQDESRASKAPKFAKEDGRVDWSRPYAEIERKVRALQPWPRAFAFFGTPKGEQRLNILALRPAAADAPRRPPGTVLAADAASGLVVATGDGAARLVRVQPEGKKPMTDTDYLRGTKIDAAGTAR